MRRACSRGSADRQTHTQRDRRTRSATIPSPLAKRRGEGNYIGRRHWKKSFLAKICKFGFADCRVETAVRDSHCAAAANQWRRRFSAACVNAGGAHLNTFSDSNVALIANIVTAVDNSSSC